MGLLAGLLTVFTLILFPIGGCNPVTTPTTVPVNFAVIGWEPPPDPRWPLEGVRLCQMDTENCILTDADGVATLMLPLGMPTGVTADKEGYEGLLVEYALEGEASFVRTLRPIQRAAEQHDRVGSPYPMRGTGTIVVGVDPVFAGATFELVGATGERFYHDEEEPPNWDPELTATTSVGSGGFTELTPGEVQVKFGGTAEDCAARTPFWAGDEPNSIRVQVREGYVAAHRMDCPPPQP